LLLNPGVWDGLKRAVRDREVRLEEPAAQFGLLPPQGLRPQPMRWDGKVIVAGEDLTYRLLSTYDRDDFWEMFKVKAEFDTEVELTQEHVDAYSAFIRKTTAAEKLLPFDRTGVARVVEYGARLVEDQNKLSTRFGQIRDVLIESDYWARKDASRLITVDHVEKAIEQKLYRLNLVEEKIRRLIAEGFHHTHRPEVVKKSMFCGLRPRLRF
jgi:predicted ATP-dependent protease